LVFIVCFIIRGYRLTDVGQLGSSLIKPQTRINRRQILRTLCLPLFYVLSYSHICHVYVFLPVSALFSLCYSLHSLLFIICLFYYFFLSLSSHVVKMMIN